jgi:hypothetical protein
MNRGILRFGRFSGFPKMGLRKLLDKLALPKQAAKGHPPEPAPKGEEVQRSQGTDQLFQTVSWVPYTCETISLNQAGFSNKTYNKIRVVMGTGITVSIIAKMIRKSSILVLIFIMHYGSRLLRNDISLHVGLLVEFREFIQDPIDQMLFVF